MRIFPVLIGILGGFGIGLAVGLGWPLQAQWSPSPLEQAIQEAIARVEPAVVSINTVYFPEMGLFPFPLRPQPEEGQGSGVIISPDGYILTNNHVIERAERILVSLPDGRNFLASLIGRDPDTDIAVVRIQGENLPVAPLGDSDTLRKGQWVVAIGNPFGLEATATAGIVSALGRRLPAGEFRVLEGLIQTDAPINPGNSGGPLVDLEGRVVGINTAVVKPGVGQGIGFAIPINLARRIAGILIQEGRVRRPWLGIIPGEAVFTEEQAREYGLPTRVVFVRDIYQPSPALQAGIRIHDVLLRIQDAEIRSIEDLRRIMKDLSPGQEVRILIWRAGRQYLARVTAREKPLQVSGF